VSELALTLRQPAQVGDGARSDFVLGTQDYLPGTVVRGAFAAAWIAANGPSAPGTPARTEFLRLFEGGVRFGPMFAGAEFMPLSVVSHKYKETDDCPVAEYDRALTGGVPTRCPECKSPLEHPKGLRGGQVATRRRTSVAIASTGVARRGQIVTRDTLEVGQTFRGTLVTADPTLLETLAGLGPVRVGGRRTTHGRATVAITEGAAPPTAQRRDEGHLVLRLRSPAVFVDNNGRPSRDPNRDELAEVLGCRVRVARRWTRWLTTGGWHIASGLPKPAELAVAPGSTYLLEPERDVTDEALAHLGRRGLGLRRNEGFGDLAPPPALAPGRPEREAEADRRGKLQDSAAALRGLSVNQPQIWQLLLEFLAGHARGEPAATQFLQRMAGQLDSGPAEALAAFLELPEADADYVAAWLRKP
jgi:CRISPR-associated protein Csx10